jgi:acyl carrier protein
MNRSIGEIRETILRGLHLIAPEADLTTLSDEVDLRRELEIDSFDFLRLLVFLNEQLAVEFPEAEYGRLTTLHNLAAFIQNSRVGTEPTKDD